MIYEKLDGLIATAMKDRAHASNELEVNSITRSLEVYRAIKTEFATQGFNATHTPSEVDEIRILNEMITKRRKTADIYENAGEKQRAADEMGEVDIILHIMPESAKGPSDEDVKKETICVVENFLKIKSMTDHTFNGNIMPFMKEIITKVKEKYPQAENGVIAAAVKSYK